MKHWSDVLNYKPTISLVDQSLLKQQINKMADGDNQAKVYGYDNPCFFASTYPESHEGEDDFFFYIQLFVNHGLGSFPLDDSHMLEGFWQQFFPDLVEDWAMTCDAMECCHMFHTETMKDTYAGFPTSKSQQNKDFEQIVFNRVVYPLIDQSVASKKITTKDCIEYLNSKGLIPTCAEFPKSKKPTRGKKWKDLGVVYRTFSYTYFPFKGSLPETKYFVVAEADGRLIYATETSDLLEV